MQEQQGAANHSRDHTAEDYPEAENCFYRRVQQDSFPDELRLLKSGKPVPVSSRLVTLAPELDENRELIRVEG